MTTYKWAGPLDWLLHCYIARADWAELARIGTLMARALDDDAIQEMFQDEMDADGYFKETE